MSSVPPLLPPQREPRQPEPGGYYHAYGYAPPPDDLTLASFFSIVRRHSVLVALCVVATVALVAAYTFLATPVYDATAVLQFEQEQVNLPQLLQELTAENRIGTGIEVLQGRSVAVAVIDSLGLRAAVAAPRGARPTKLFALLKVAPKADTATLVLRAAGAGRFTVRRLRSADTAGAAVAPDTVVGKLGDTVRLAGVTLAPRAAALAHPEVQVRVASMDGAVRRFKSSLKVDRPARDADLISVRVRSADPVLATDAANLVAAEYIASRQEVRMARTGSTVGFLREQLDTLGDQLHAAEEALREYRQETGLVDAQEQARTQVGRLIQIQAERGGVEAERRALAMLLGQMRRDSAVAHADGEAPASRLISFPTLFRNQAASELLGALAQVQNQRSALMTRRTAQDPDVQVLTVRIAEIDAQLQGIAETYLEGLTDQEASLDVVARRFGRVLSTLPAEEVQTARLEREVKVRQDLYTLLQTRLKESQITQAMADPSIHVVDAAAVPERPVRPNKPLNLALGLVLGCLLALSAALARELSDRAVRSRTDATLASGLPILGVLPRLRRGGRALPGSTWRLVESPRDGGRGHRVLMGPRPDGKPRTSRHSRKARVLTTLADATPSYAEALNQLHANLALNYRERPLKVVVFTSPLPGEGKTLTSVNFALMLAGRGLRVLLIDADLKCGLVNEVFGSRRRPGFAEVLAGEAGFGDAVRLVSVGERGKLAFLPSGALADTPGRLPGMERLREVLGALAPAYDVVLIDSPPVNLLADASLLGSAADAVLLVVRAGRTRVEALRYAMDQLTAARAPVIGTLLNDIDPRRGVAYDGSYSYLTGVDRYYVAGNGHNGHGK